MDSEEEIKPRLFCSIWQVSGEEPFSLNGHRLFEWCQSSLDFGFLFLFGNLSQTPLQCKAAEMRISNFKSEAMVFSWKRMGSARSRLETSFCPSGGVHVCQGVATEWGESGAGVWGWCGFCSNVEAESWMKVKVSIFHSSYAPPPPWFLWYYIFLIPATALEICMCVIVLVFWIPHYDHKLWVATKRMRHKWQKWASSKGHPGPGLEKGWGGQEGFRVATPSHW